VIDFLQREAAVGRWLEDVRGLLERWLPEIVRENRSSSRSRSAVPAAGTARSTWPKAWPPPSPRNGASWCAIATSRSRTGNRRSPALPAEHRAVPGRPAAAAHLRAALHGDGKVCLKESSPFGVCLIREGSEVGKPAVPAEIGTFARITDWDMPQLGLLQVVARGEGRFRILERRVERDGSRAPALRRLPTTTTGRCVCKRALRRLLERLLNETPDAIAGPHRLDSSWWSDCASPNCCRCQWRVSRNFSK